MTTKLNDQKFQNWNYEEIEIDRGEPPVRIYYSAQPKMEFLEFLIVESHGLEIPKGRNSSDIDTWDIECSHVKIIGTGYFSHKGFSVKIDSDLSTECKIYINIFTKLQRIFEANLKQ